MRVTVGGKHFEHAATELQDRDIKRTATQVEDRNLHVLVRLVHTVSQSGSRRLVHDTLHVQTGNLSGFLCSLTLRVGEVGRYGDDGFRHFLAQIILGRLLHLLQNHGRDFLRSVQTSFDVHARGVVVSLHYRIRHTGYFLLHLVIGLTHETLDGEHGVLRVGDGLTLGGVTHQTLAVLKRHDGRRSALALVVGNHHRFVTFKYGNTRVRGSQVNTNNLSHNRIYFYY